MPHSLVRRATDCVLTLDADGRVASLNRTAATLLGDALVGDRLEDHLATDHAASLRRGLAEVRESGRAVGPLDLAVRHGGDVVWLNATLHADGSGGTTIAGWDVTALRAADRDAARQAARLRLLFAVSTPSEAPFHEQASQALALTTDLLGLDIGILSCIQDDCYTVVACHTPDGALSPGDEFPLGDTYCSITLAADDIVAIDHMAESEHHRHPCYQAFGLETYIGFPVHVDGKLFGTLNFSAATPNRHPYTDADGDLIRLLALWAGTAMERDEREATFRAQAERLEAVVREAPLILFAVDAEGDFVFCEGNGLERLGQTSESFAGVNVFEAYADYPVVVDNIRAVLEGEPRSWTATVDGATFEVRARPSYAADGTVEGMVAVSTDITRRVQADAARREVEARYRALSSASFEAIAFSEHGVVVDANEQFAHLLGFSSVVDVLGLSAADVCHPDSRDLVLTMIREDREEVYEARCVRRDGTTFWAEIQGRKMERDGRQLRVTAFRDVTARRAAEAHTRFQADVLSQVSDAVVALDVDGRVTYWNDAAERLHGVAADAALGRPLDDVIHYELPDADVDLSPQDLIESGSHDALIYIRPDGERRYVSVSSSTLRSAEGEAQGLLAVTRDVTARREMALRLQHQATHDALTGLPNRSAFGDRIAAALAAGDPFGVLFLDLDRFKGVNDTLGHDAGDRLLVAVAERMRDAVGEAGLVARFGGDEFGIVAEADAAGVQALAGRVLDAIAQPVNVGERTLTPHASVGTVASAERYDAADELLRDADTAMYEAKRSGRGRAALFDPAMQVTASVRFGLETELRHAVERGQLRIVLQPIVDLATGAVGGFESLVRWQHPEMGLVLPDRFIPIAEDMGLVPDIDRWVLAEACRTVGAWEERVPLFLSVNCSDQAFIADELPGLVEAAAHESGLTADHIVLELTERALVDKAAALRQIEALRARGIRLTIDDFGSGYSSLGLLHALPVDGLKIDRSFVSDLEASSSARAVVRAVTSFSDDLGLRIVAEGIETAGQLALLREAGCQYGQGYLFSRPVPAAVAQLQLRDHPWAHLFRPGR